jgi:EAL and modified HD-GYP domain-containing signal transduction protein
MRLLALIRDERTTESELERAFQGNVTLTVKLLRAVNAVAVGGRGVTSIRHAIRMLGHGELTRWLSLMLVTSGECSSAMDAELISVALRRARMCEVLAVASGQRPIADAAFIVGLFSLLDAVFKAPMDELLDALELAPELTAAIRSRTGRMGHLLAVVERFERGAWSDVIAASHALHVDVRELNDAYVEGLEWAASRLAAPDMVG